MGDRSGRRANPERTRSTGLCGAAALAGFIGALLFPAGASAATVTFNYNGTTGSDGSAQLWTVPAGVSSATFDLYGAQGAVGAGPSYPPRAPGGLGAHLRATVALTPGQQLRIFVGGGPLAPGAPLTSGGFNGGGDPGVDGNTFDLSGGGGGASDIRTGPALSERILIAAGGGGGAGNGYGPGPGAGGGPAGGAGGDSGASGANGANFDANTRGGGGGGNAGVEDPGGFGEGGAGAEFDGLDGNPGSLGEGGDTATGSGTGGAGGGGGGGRYGGGSGGEGGWSLDPEFLGAGGGGGGGGASFAIPSATGVVLLDGVRTGPGQVVISYADPPAAKPSPRITHKPKNRKRGSGKKKRKNKRYVFRFADDTPGVSFLCKLDKRPFTPCTSPAIYRGLKPGRHAFQVKSVTADGVESAPQTTSFRVPRPGKARRR